VESGDNWLERSESGYVTSRNLQDCIPLLCRLRTVRLAPVSKYWTYWSHIGDMCLVSWCSCVTIWLKPLSPTLRLSHGRRNEATQDGGRVSLSLVAKTSFGWRGLFWLHGSQWKVFTYGDCPQKSYAEHAWTGVRSVCVVLVGFSPTGCTLIRIAATLRYE
jgi:hypothetical protein